VVPFLVPHHICQRWKDDTQKEPLISHSVPQRPWEKVGIDLFEYNQHSYLITVDYFSNYFEIDRLYGKKSVDIIYKLKQHWARQGIPLQCCTDNGPPFNSDAFKYFAKCYEF